MHSIGEILSTARKKKGLSQSELAVLLQKEGFSQSFKAISKWEKNTSEPSVTLFLTLCRILDITDIYEAYYGVNPNNIQSALSPQGREKVMDYIDLLHATGRFENENANIVPFKRIDVYETPVSAGTGNFLTDGIKTTLTIDDSKNVPKGADFGVRISGDSMEPEFSNGEIAWVVRQGTVENGEIGIFILNGDAYIKRLKNDASGTCLISLNKAYAPIRVSMNDRFDIFGKVAGKYGCNK